MTFLPPGLTTLKVNTHNLDARFSTLIGCYAIVPDAAADASASPKPNTLNTLIARVIPVTTCTTDRKAAQEAITLLVNELREILIAKDEAKFKQATLILLGGLLHRYFRVIKEYDDYNKSITVWGYSLFAWNLSSCRFFKAIRKALHLPDEMPGDFRTKDLAVLDVNTIVTALECFQSHMFAEDRYKKIPHFASDLNFKTYLQDIIDGHKRSGAHALNQFKAINFIQSLTKRIDEENQQIEVELDKWIKFLKRDHVDFSALDADTIDDHIEAHVTESLRKKISVLLYSPLVHDQLKTFNHETFLGEMKRCSSNRCSYMIMGGCALILESGRAASDNLKYSVNQVLQIEDAPEKLTDKDKIIGMKSLSQFIEANPESVFDTEFFGGLDKFKTELVKKPKIIADRIKEAAEDVVLVASM